MRVNTVSTEFAERAERRGDFALAAEHWGDAATSFVLGLNRVYCERRRQQALSRLPASRPFGGELLSGGRS